MFKIKALILPDIHGRTFWKNAVDMFPIDEYPDLDIVFLGDYVDPYVSYDGITKEDAYNNFLDIIDYIKNDKRVIPLIGNHDWHYFVNFDSSRIDRARESEIEKLFVNNINLFRLSYEIKINDITYLLSHAGITYGWLDEIKTMAKYSYRVKNPVYDHEIEWNDFLDKLENLNIDTYNDFSVLDKCLYNYDDLTYTRFISIVGPDRGGYRRDSGSIIWADVHEHLYSKESLSKYYQIFGHTITYPDGPESYYISDKNDNKNFNIAMIDASQAFVLTDDNKLMPLNEFK